MTTGRIEMGPTSRTVADNLRRLREARGLSLRALSAELRRVGRMLSADALNKIENGRTLEPDAEAPKQVRRADVDDLMALAAALRVNPSALLLPPTIKGDVELTGVGPVSARAAWDWADGKRPLHVPEDDDGTALVEFQRNARPPGRRSWAVTTPAGMLQAAIETGAPPEKIRELREVFGYPEDHATGQGN